MSHPSIPMPTQVHEVEWPRGSSEYGDGGSTRLKRPTLAPLVWYLGCGTFSSKFVASDGLPVPEKSSTHSAERVRVRVRDRDQTKKLTRHHTLG